LKRRTVTHNEERRNKYKNDVTDTTNYFRTKNIAQSDFMESNQYTVQFHQIHIECTLQKFKCNITM
jgi:hypothetical protein